jgi:hypothetical protein
MKNGILFAVSFLLLTQGVFPAGMGTILVRPPEAASTPLFEVKPIHPLPDWDGQEDLTPQTRAVEESSPRRLKITFPVACLATLLFFLMWKFLQGQE